MKQTDDHGSKLRIEDRVVDDETVSLLVTRLAEETPTWMHDASCVAYDTEHEWGLDPVSDTDTMVTLCSACPVSHLCRTWADRYRVTYGVFAGEDKNNRV